MGIRFWRDNENSGLGRSIQVKVMEVLVEILKGLIIFIKDIISSLINIIISIFYRAYEKYRDIGLAEKIIIINSIPAFFAIILPVARYYIFEVYFHINNPLAVYMIGIVLIMFITLYLKGLTKLMIRLIFNGYYIFWIIYIPLTGELTKADPYEISIGYYFNIAVPIVYCISSLVSFFYSYE